MSEVPIVQVKTKTELLGSEVQAASIVITHSVNNYGIVQVTHYSGPRAENSAISVTSDDVFKLMGSRQSSYFTETVSRPTATIDVQTEGGDAKYHVNFKGFLSNSSYNFTSSTVGMSDTCLDEFAAVDSFDLSIYPVKPGNIELFPKVTLQSCNYSIAKMIYALIEEFMSVKLPTESQVGKITAASIKRQDSINRNVLHHIKALLDNSEETMGWKEYFQKAADKMKALNSGVRRSILTCLQTSRGSFLTTLQALGETFNAIIVPEISSAGEVSYKYLNRQFMFDNGELLSIPITTLTATAGSTAGIFPTRYVAVYPMTSKVNSEQISSTPDFVTYPTDAVEGGSKIKVPGPTWCPDVSLVQVADKSGTCKEQAITGAMTRNIPKKAAEQGSKYLDVRAEILQEWAIIAYKTLALKDATVHLTVPLIQNVSPGKRYYVASPAGGILFSGFCTSVRTMVATGSQKKAEMVISFSHVEMATFSLPGKE